MGAQVCNQSGSGFDPCECVDTSNATTPQPTTDDPTTGEPDPTDATTTDATTDASTSTTEAMTDTSDASSSTGEPEPPPPYGACPSGEDRECLPGETCITGNAMMVAWNLCTPNTCMDADDCGHAPGDACADTPGDGEFQPYCVPQLCTPNEPCPDGMLCVQGFGGGNPPSVCLWPT